MGSQLSGCHENIVAACTDHVGDKFALLEQVLDESRFFQVLEAERQRQKKAPKELLIAIKPNISMMLRRSDVGTYTDPFLVIHLLRLLLQRGYTRLAVVESQNLYGNWFTNRSVVKVAARAGYLPEVYLRSSEEAAVADIHVRGGGVDARVPLVDLTLERECHRFEDGSVELGQTWINADYRISMASLKAHFYAYYSVGIKNIYGCLPLQDKVRAYHCHRKVAPWTAELIARYPVHFSVVAAYSAADGWMGVKMRAIPKKTHTIVAGVNIMAVDHFCARLMRLDPESSILYRTLKKYCPLTSYQVVGNARPFDDWLNVPPWLVKLAMSLDVSATLMDYGGFVATGGNDPCFERKKEYGSGLIGGLDSLLKRVTFAFSLPVAFFLDFEIVKLRMRKLTYWVRMLNTQGRLPLITSSAFLMERLVFLSAEDVQRLVLLLEENIQGPVTFSGHYLFDATHELVFPARLFTATIAAVNLINYMIDYRLDRQIFREELREYRCLYGSLFGRETSYAYCYR